MAAPIGEAQWPPRSPHEARMSTPGGRQRLRELAGRTSPSPSPIKRSNTTSILHSRAQQATRALGGLEDDDDDEETLQLRLQEIQARLKLKKLQKAKSTVSLEPELERPRSTAAPTRSGSSAISRVDAIREERLRKAKLQQTVDVPVSPVRKVIAAPEPQRSPGRVLLGIDKGLKGSDVSLRRAPSLRKPAEDREEMSRRLGGYLKRPDSQLTSVPQSQAPIDESKPPRTFSERMADIRNQDAERKEKDKRVQRARSKTFDIDERTIEELKQTAATLPETKYHAPEFSRDQILSSFNKPIGGILQRSKSAASLNSQIPPEQESVAPTSSTASTLAISRGLRPGRRVKLDAPSSSTITDDDRQAATFESYSCLHLSRRVIPHNILARTLSGKKIMSIPDMLRDVKGPDFSLPAVEEDIVLLAVVASKSAPRSHAKKNNSTTPAKYMVLTLTDLKWELELYLFNSGFDKFWKLTLGTVIAILNPSIMPPMNKDTGRFSVTINSSDETILEIGAARDLGFCKSVKKDGKTCDSWVDSRHTEYCDFHTNEALNRTKAGRMEVNTMDFGRGKKQKKEWGGGGRRDVRSRVIVQADLERAEKAKEYASGIRHIREGGVGKIQIMQSSRSTTDLLDDEYFAGDAFHYGTKEERMRQRHIVEERERDIAKKLGNIGGGLGADYMRIQQTSNLAALEAGYEAPEGPPTPPDAKKLGLLGGNAAEMHLSPIKRKRALGSASSSISGAPAGMGGGRASARGWGGALSKDLGRMKEGESLSMKAPVKKKTRIMTDKGIRMPGRESFGGEMVGQQGNGAVDDDDDDDDLDIIR